MSNLISIVMAVHNGMPYLPDSINSILKQSWQDFEFIIVDDASNDGSLERIREINDERITLIVNPQRAGLAASLIIGLEASKGEFIARMDADDVSLPARFERQLDLIKAHPEIDICGTWARTIGSKPRQLWQYPASDANIKAEMLFASVLVHSSVMLRRKSIEAHNIRYNEKLEAAQDYELWVRLSNEVTFANLPEVLVEYRLHENQVGEQRSSAQRQVADSVRESQLNNLGIAASKQEIALHHQLSRWDFGNSSKDLREIESWLEKLLKANTDGKLFDQRALESAVEQRWWAACRAHVSNGKVTWEMYRASSLSSLADRSALQKATLYAKTVTRELGLRH